MDKILLKGMAFYGWHGVLREEQVLGQRFTIDAELYASLAKAAETDAIEDTVNYAKVYEVIRDIMNNQRFALLEALAREIGKQILLQFSLVEHAVITVHKPSAPIPGVLDEIAVTIESGRHEQ